MLPVILGLFFLAACAAPSAMKSQRKKPAGASFQVDESDGELLDAVQAAATAWSYALGVEITVSPEGEVPVFWVPDLDVADPECAPPPDRPAGAWGGACTPGIGTPDMRILVNQKAPSKERLLMWMLHEMGHVLAGRGGHLGDPGFPPVTEGSIMQRYNEGETDGFPRLVDVRYVCESPTGIACPGPLGRLSIPEAERPL